MRPWGQPLQATSFSTAAIVLVTVSRMAATAEILAPNACRPRTPVPAMACFVLTCEDRDNFGHHLPLHRRAWLLFPFDRQDNDVERSRSRSSPALMEGLAELARLCGSCPDALDTYLARVSRESPVPQKSTCQCLFATSPLMCSRVPPLWRGLQEVQDALTRRLTRELISFFFREREETRVKVC